MTGTESRFNLQAQGPRWRLCEANSPLAFGDLPEASAGVLALFRNSVIYATHIGAVSSREGGWKKQKVSRVFGIAKP